MRSVNKMDKRGDVASKRGSEMGSQRPSIFSRPSQIQKRMDHERALQEKAKQIEDEYIALIDPETQQVVGEDGELYDENGELVEGDKMTSIS